MEFHGFPEEGLTLLAELADNNNRSWFKAHKEKIERSVLEPAQAFVVALGEGLQSIAPAIRYDTRVNGQGSLMRIYRDTRFSADKRPYKDNVSGLLWEGSGKKSACPAFGFRLRSSGMGLMAGMFAFDREMLERYRKAVDDRDLGEQLGQVVKQLDDEMYELVGQHYMRVPRGYPSDHPRAELLKFKGLYVHPKEEIQGGILSMPELISVCMDHFQRMAPLQRWLVAALAP